MIYKQFLIRFFKISIIALLIELTINMYVDPLNYIRANTKTYFSSERSLKARLIEDGIFSGLMMGSSKTAHIRPTKINFNKKIFNASFSAALPEEIYSFLVEHNPEVEWIAIGLEWYMFHESRFPYKENVKFSKNFMDIVRYCLSLDTTIYSIRTIMKRIGGDSSYSSTPNGARNKEKKEAIDRNNSEYKYSETLDRLSFRFDDYKISSRRIFDISKIEDWGKANNIKIVWWISPYNKEILKLLHSKHNKEIDNLPIVIKEKVSNFIDLSHKYKTKDKYWKHDPSHYYQTTGEFFFNKNILPIILNKL